MAGSGTYQVAVGRHQDIAAPFLAGTSTLSNALQTNVNNRLNKDKFNQGQLEHANLMGQRDADRASREAIAAANRSALAKHRKRGYDRQDKIDRGEDSIANIFSTLNKPGGTQEGLEIRSNINSAYNIATDQYETAVAMHKEEKDSLKPILDAANFMSTNYDAGGNPIENSITIDVRNKEKELKEDAFSIENTYNGKLNQLDMLAKSTTDMQLPTVDPQIKEIFQENFDDAQAEETIIKNALNTQVDTLNTGVQGLYANNSNLLDTVVNPTRVAKEMHQKALAGGASMKQANAMAKEYMKQHEGAAPNNNIINAIEKQIDNVYKGMNEGTTKTEVGTGSENKTGTSSSSSSSDKYSRGKKQALEVFTKANKFNKDNGLLDFGKATFSELEALEKDLRADQRFKNHSDSDINQALVNSITSSIDGGYDVGKKDAVGYLLQNPREDDYTTTGGKGKTTTTNKRKVPNKAEAAKLNSLNMQLQQALGGGRPTIKNTLGKEFIDTASNFDLAKTVKTNKTNTPKRQPKPVPNTGTGPGPAVKDKLEVLEEPVTKKEEKELKEVLKESTPITQLKDTDVRRFENMLNTQGLVDNTAMFVPAVKGIMTSIKGIKHAISVILRGRHINKLHAVEKLKIKEAMGEGMKKLSLLKKHSGKVARMKKNTPKRVPRKIKDLKDLTFTAK